MSEAVPQHISDPLARFKGKRISSAVEPERLAEQIQASLGQDYRVDFERGSQGYTRLVVSHGRYTGRKALVLDVRGGAFSAHEATPALMLRVSDVEEGSEIAVGAKVLKRGGKWELASPYESLSDVIRASFHAASIHETNLRGIQPGKAEEITPTGEVYSILTSGETRHRQARHKFGVPAGALLVPHFASQGEQLQAARAVGVFFDVDDESEESEWLQIKRQRDEIAEGLVGLRGVFGELMRQGFYAFTKGDDRQFRLQRLTDTSTREGFLRALGWTVKGMSAEEIRESLLKTIKMETTIARSRSGPQVMEPYTDKYGRTRWRPQKPLTIEEAVAQAGQMRYWERDSGKKTLVYSGIIEPGEQHQRAVHVMRTMVTKTPWSGGSMIDPSMLEQSPRFGATFYMQPEIDLSRIKTVEQLMGTEFQFENLAGESFAAMRRKPFKLGSVTFANEAESHPTLLQSKAFDIEFQGADLHIPDYYDPATGEFYSHRFVDDKELVSTAQIAKELRKKLAKQGIKGVRIRRGATEGVSLTARATGLVSGSPKSAGFKPGTAVLVGTKRMTYDVDEGGNIREIPVDLATGEAKQIIESMKGAFRVMPWEWRLGMLSMIGQMKIGNKVVNVGEALSQFASQRFGESKVINIDELTEEFRRVTGDEGGHWSDIFGAMYEQVINAYRESGDPKIRAFLEDIGIMVPPQGKLYMGLLHKDIVEKLKELQGEANLFEFKEHSDSHYEGWQYVDPWAGGKPQALIMPVGFEYAFEWPGKAKRLNLESLASLAANFPKLAEKLGALPGQGPVAGRPSRAWKAWHGVLKSYALQEAVNRGATVEHKGEVRMSKEAALKISNALSLISPTDETERFRVISKILKEEIRKQYTGEHPATIYFDHAKRYLPAPQHVADIDFLEEGAKESKAHFISQYVRAIEGLVDKELHEGLAPAKTLDAHNRFLGGIRSRIGKIIGQGESVVDMLFGRMISNAVSQHYFVAPFLGTGEAWITSTEVDRIAYASGMRTKGDVEQYKKLLQEVFEGKLPGTLQRYPVVSPEYGTIPLIGYTTEALRKYLGVDIPNDLGLAGLIGINPLSPRALQGDFDLDPNQFVSGLIASISIRRWVDEKGRKRRTREVHLNDDAFWADIAHWQQALGRDPFKAETYEAANLAIMGYRAEEMDTLRAALEEMKDVKKSALDTSERMRWIPLVEMMRAAQFYYDAGKSGGGVLQMRGISYNIAREIRALAAQLKLSPGVLSRISNAFALMYQQTLEYNLLAGQETEIAAMINKAMFEVFEDEGRVGLALKTVLGPTPSHDPDQQPAWPRLFFFAGQDEKITNAEDLAWAKYPSLVESLASAPLISDDLLAFLSASYGEAPEDFDVNRATILARLQEHRKAAVQRGYDEATIAKGRFTALTGIDTATGGRTASLLKGAIGPYNPITTLILSSAIEKAGRDPSNPALWLQNVIPWRGKWYSLMELQELPEFKNTQALRGLLTGSRRNSLESPLVDAATIVEMAQSLADFASDERKLLSPGSEVAQAVMALYNYWGLISAHYKSDPLTSEQLAVLRSAPAKMRSSQVSSIAAPALMAAMAQEKSAEVDPIEKSAFARNALIDLAANQLARALGQSNFPTSIFAHHETAATKMGDLFEEYMAATGEYGVHAAGSEAGRAAALRFRIGDTELSGVPDFLRIEDTPHGRRLRVIEAKLYQNPREGAAVGLAQATLYREALIGLARGDSKVRLADKTAQEAQAQLKSILKSWASEYAATKAGAGLDVEQWVEEAFGLAQAGAVDIGILVGRPRAPIASKGAEAPIEEKLPFEIVYTPDVEWDPGRLPSAEKLVRYAGAAMQRNMPRLLEGFAALLSRGRLPGISELDPSLRISRTEERVKRGVIPASFIVRAGQAAKHLRDLLNRAAQFMGEAPKDDPERTMIRSGETVRSGHDAYVMLGPESPHDTHTISEAAEEGLLVPKEAIDQTAAAIRATTGGRISPQEAERSARRLMTKGIYTRQYDDEDLNFGEVQGLPDSGGEPGVPRPKDIPPEMQAFIDAFTALGGPVHMHFSTYRGSPPDKLTATQRVHRAVSAAAELENLLSEDFMKQLRGELGLAPGGSIYLEKSDEIRAGLLMGKTLQEMGLSPESITRLRAITKAHTEVAKHARFDVQRAAPKNVVEETGFAELVEQVQAGTTPYGLYLQDIAALLGAAEVERALGIKPTGAKQAPVYGMLSDQERTETFDRLRESVDQLTGVMIEQGRVSKQQIEVAKKQVEQFESIGDVADLTARISDTQARLDQLMGGRSFGQLTSDEQVQALDLQRQIQQMSVRKWDQQVREMATRLEADEARSPSARLGFAMRSIFGGLGWFYLQRVLGAATSSLVQGYLPTQELEALSWSAAAGAFGQAAGPSGVRAHEYQRALLLSGGGFAQILQNFRQATTGTVAEFALGSLQAAGGTALASMFIGAELAQVGALAGGAVLPMALTAASLAAIAAPIAMQAGYMADRENTIMRAAAQQAGGRFYESAWNLLGFRTVHSLRNGGWAMSPEEQEAMGLGITAEWFLSGRQPFPITNDVNYIRRLAHVIAMVPGSPFKNLPPEIVEQVIIRSAASGLPFRIEDILKYATAEATGFKIHDTARQLAPQLGLLPTAENVERLKQSLSIRESEADVFALGAQVISQMPAAWREVMAPRRGGIPDAMAYAAYAASPYADLMARAQQAFARDFAAGDFGAFTYRTDEQVARMTPEEAAEYEAALIQRERYQSLRDRARTQFGRQAAARFTRMATRLQGLYGERGLAGTEAVYDLYAYLYQRRGADFAMQAVSPLALQAARGHMAPLELTQAAISGDPIALQMMMLQNPAVAQAFAERGIPQLVDVNAQGQITGLPLWTTYMSPQTAQGVWGANWMNTIGRYAVQGYTPIFSSTGRALQGIRGIQAYMADLSYQSQMASIGAALAQLELQYAFTTGVGLQAYSGIVNPQTGRPFRFRTGPFSWEVEGVGSYRSRGGGFWGMEDATRFLGYAQQEWQFAFSQRQLEMQARQFYENIGMNWIGMMMQRDFTRADWRWQDWQRATQWAWKREDFAEEARFLTGRERRLAERQMRRESIMYSAEGERIDEQRRQQQEIWRLEDARFEIQKRHYEEQKAMQQEQMEVSRAFYEERKRLEEESIKLQRAYWTKQIELQEQQIGAQAGYAAALHQTRTQMDELQQAIEDQMAAFKMAWEYYKDLSGPILDNVADFIRKVIDMARKSIPGGGGGSGMGGGGCFTSNTPITMADGSTKPIWRVLRGDKVLAFDPETGKLSAQTVLANYAFSVDGYLRLEFSDSRSVTCTGSHPFWTPNREPDALTVYGSFTRAENLGVGDEVMHLIDGKPQPVKVTAIAVIHNSALVHDLTVEDTHTFIAGGNLVHNKYEQPIGASGLDMIVPAGYDNDDYYVRVRSGERVRVTPPFAHYGKLQSPWERTIDVRSPKPQAQAGPIYLTVRVGDQVVKKLVLETWNQEVEL